MNGGRRLALGCAGLLSVLLVAGLPHPASAQAKPEGEMRYALYVTLSPVWFDPGEVSGQLTPFWILYALHDALVKPMPGSMMSPSLAEGWTVSADQRVFSFRDLRNYLPPARESSNALTLWDTRERGMREIAAIAEWFQGHPLPPKYFLRVFCPTPRAAMLLTERMPTG